MKKQKTKLGKVNVKKRSNNDYLVDMFELQRDLQARLYEKDPSEFDDKTKIRYIEHMVFAGMVELAEAIDWLSWKGWKKFKPPTENDVLEYKVELVDVMHFVINAFMAYGGTAEEMFKLFVGKNKINHKRQDDGY